MLAPSAMAWSAAAHSASIAASRSGPGGPVGGPEEGRQRDAAQTGQVEMLRILASSRCVRIGRFRITWRQLCGPGLSRLRSAPSATALLVTISSRMASMGGLVTWANSCLK